MTPATDARSEGEGRLLAWIKVTTKGELVEFTGMAEASKPTEVQYLMRVLRLSGGGRSATSQGGRTALAVPGEPRELSTVSLNVEDRSSYAVELFVNSTSGIEVSTTISNPPLEPL